MNNSAYDVKKIIEELEKYEYAYITIEELINITKSENVPAICNKNE